MKKYFIVFAILIFSSAFSLADDEAFYSALQNCKAYSNQGQTKTDGNNIAFKSQILGWENNKCTYKESVSFAGMDSCTICKFSKDQINELVTVMRAYSTVQKYSGETVDTSSLSAAQNNPVVRVWNKYLSDPAVCNIEFSK